MKQMRTVLKPNREEDLRKLGASVAGLQQINTRKGGAYKANEHQRLHGEINLLALSSYRAHKKPRQVARAGFLLQIVNWLMPAFDQNLC
ncbi:MAG: hypothetical protein PHQ58_10555 [Rhodoferax sp.]|uniref:hypothetical protein n=1 Tax=Rhodoferax sp. TaxID=50421 RepID=UPI00262DA586|nr:hypothetical protein [Rhodoferax sp.]MDD2880871.1 hypothetical protein [Rhodoferax sp.]